MPAREAQGEAQWEPEPCASGSSRGLTPPGPWGRAVLGQPSQAYANQMGPGLGGFGRTWQDSLPREELDQDRLLEGVGWAWGQGRKRPLPSSPWGQGSQATLGGLIQPTWAEGEGIAFYLLIGWVGVGVGVLSEI